MGRNVGSERCTAGGRGSNTRLMCDVPDATLCDD